jgi:hypothetical protein
MRVRPDPCVTANVTADGCLELLDSRTGMCHRWYPPMAAMWMALQQHDGQPALAATALAAHWRTDPLRIRHRFDPWLTELRELGLVHFI